MIFKHGREGKTNGTFESILLSTKVILKDCNKEVDKFYKSYESCSEEEVAAVSDNK